MGKKSKKSSVTTVHTTKQDDQNFYNGIGDFVLPNGDRYSGNYCAHMSGKIWREGQGKYETLDGHCYEGLWYNDNLVNGAEVTVTYQDGTTYQGPFMNNKYNGPGCMQFKNGLRFFAHFENNKPKGDILLADVSDRLWRGPANENNAFLAPENIFFNNINEHRGKNVENLKSLEPDLVTPSQLSSNMSVPVTDKDHDAKKDLEKMIFARKTLINSNIDFTDNEWYQNYVKYKNMREHVLGKMKTQNPLTDKERKWYRCYARYKKHLQEKAAAKAKQAVDETVDTTLLDHLYVEKYAQNYKPYSVFYPSYNWVGTSEDGTSETRKISKEKCKEDLIPVNYLSDYLDNQGNSEEEEDNDDKRRDVGCSTASLFNYIETIMGEGRVNLNCK